MAIRKKSRQNDFLYNDEQSNEQVKALAASAVIQPKMLPPFFREKSRLLQKIYIFMIIISISVTVGITAFVMLDNFAQKYGIVTGTQIVFLITTLVFWYLIIGAGVVFIWWSRTKNHIFTLIQTLTFIIAPITLSAIMIYFDFYTPPSSTAVYDKLFFIFGLGAVAAVGAIILVTLIGNLIKTKIYRQSKFRTFYTIPGYAILSAAPLLIWLEGKDIGFSVFTVSAFVYSVAALFGGAIVMALGIIISYKYRAQEQKQAATSIKLSGSLPSMMVAITILAIGLRFASLFQFQLPFILVIVIDLALLIGFGVFLFFRARIKNMTTTNPLLNEFIIKGFIITIALVGLIFITLIPKIIEVKSFAPLSFGILAVSGLSIAVIVSTSHFMNLIVFEKFIKTIIGTVAATMAILLIIIFTLGTLKNSGIIIQVIARAICMVYLIVLIAGEGVLMFLDIGVIQKDIYKVGHSKKVQARKENEKLKLAAKEEGQAA